MLFNMTLGKISAIFLHKSYNFKHKLTYIYIYIYIYIKKLLLHKKVITEKL